jgi:hypothetical protein
MEGVGNPSTQDEWEVIEESEVTKPFALRDHDVHDAA